MLMFFNRMCLNNFFSLFSMLDYFFNSFFIQSLYSGSCRGRCKQAFNESFCLHTNVLSGNQITGRAENSMHGGHASSLDGIRSCLLINHLAQRVEVSNRGFDVLQIVVFFFEKGQTRLGLVRNSRSEKREQVFGAVQSDIEGVLASGSGHFLGQVIGFVRESQDPGGVLDGVNVLFGQIKPAQVELHFLLEFVGRGRGVVHGSGCVSW